MMNSFGDEVSDTFWERTGSGKAEVFREVKREMLRSYWWQRKELWKRKRGDERPRMIRNGQWARERDGNWGEMFYLWMTQGEKVGMHYDLWPHWLSRETNRGKRSPDCLTDPIILPYNNTERVTYIILEMFLTLDLWSSEAPLTHYCSSAHFLSVKCLLIFQIIVNSSVQKVF